MKVMFSLFAFTLGAAFVLAEPPKVDVPLEVIAKSDYVVVEPKTTAKQVTYIGMSGVDAVPSGLLKDKNTFVFYTRGLKAGKYVFKGVASLNDEHTVFPLIVVVEGGGVDPVVPVVPVVPTDKLGLVKASKDGLAKQAATSKKTALALAHSLLASAVAAGAYGDDAPKILAAWRVSNKNAVESEDWKEWGVVVSAKVQELYAAGKLAKRGDWADAFNEIAIGLK